MMNLTDAIEADLRQRLAAAPHHTIRIQRMAIAHTFDCVPSQVTYVLHRRFTPGRGFLVHGVSNAK